MPTSYNMSTMPLTWRHYLILIISSMEQIIGAAMSTVVGVMIPMIMLLKHMQLHAAIQGIIGASGLIGIAFGSAVIGRLCDKEGYLRWFRICPVIIIAGSAIVYCFPDTIGLITGLFIIGTGVGGGYSLDSSYVSEIMPDRWKLLLVGVAKGTCAIGFLGAAVACMLILKHDPSAKIWNSLIIIIGILGFLTFIMRIRWRESPHWLMTEGETNKAEQAAQFFLGDNVTIPQPQHNTPTKNVPFMEMFRGDNLKKVILTGIPWACEGLGVYGFGVFLPVLIMALGIAPAHSEGMSSVVDSIEMTAVVNFFILPGFVMGLLVVNRINHIKMLAGGFLICSVGLLILLAAYLLKLPTWVSIAGFVVFEVFLNAGPHLVTFILPSQIYPVETRGTGSGIAAMLGKTGAVAGVFLMPALLKWGGATCVLIVSFIVQLTGAIIAICYRNIANSKTNS